MVNTNVDCRSCMLTRNIWCWTLDSKVKVSTSIYGGIGTPLYFLRVSSRVFAPLTVSANGCSMKQTYINFHAVFDEVWDADRTLCKDTYSSRRNQRTTTEKTVISHDFFRVSAIHEARHTYRSQGAIVERHIATSIASPADVLRVSSRILAPLTVTAYKRSLDENKLTSISTAFLMRPEMQTELCPKTGTLPEGIKGLLQTKQLFPTTFFGVSAIHEARIWIACSAGVFFGRENVLLAKAPCWNSKREEKMGRVKRSGVGGVDPPWLREKRKRLPENTVKMRNTPAVPEMSSRPINT